jgi:hypothetical protein
MVRVYFNAHGSTPWSVDHGDGTKEIMVGSIVGKRGASFTTCYNAANRGSATKPCAWLELDCDIMEIDEGKAILG